MAKNSDRTKGNESIVPGLRGVKYMKINRKDTLG
jgi:hypothetical protein